MSKDAQLVVWPSTIVGKDKAEEFESFFKEQGFEVKYETEYETLPDEGQPDTGGRNDVLFRIDTESIGKFAIWRLQHGMRWWEDYLDNGSDKIVPVEILNEYKYGWDKETDPDNGRPEAE